MANVSNINSTEREKRLTAAIQKKCDDGYGVNLDKLENLGCIVLGPQQAVQTGDLEPNITGDPNFLGCLQIPLCSIGGKPIGDLGRDFFRYRLFFETPKSQFGIDVSRLYKKKRYRQATGSRSHPFFPPQLALKKLADEVDVPIILVEGELKCVAWSLLNHFTIGLPSLNNFSPQKEVLPELTEIQWVGRTVYLAPDNDCYQKASVQRAVINIGRQLELMGADVYVLIVPQTMPLGSGIDDFLVHHGPDAVDLLIEDAQPLCDFSDLETTSTGTVKNTTANLMLSLAKLGWNIRYNTWRRKIEIIIDDDTQPLDDNLLSRLMVEIAVRFKFQPNKNNLVDVLNTTAKWEQYHPVHEYLSGCLWDGEVRIDHWINLTLGAADTPLNRAFARKTLLGAVARVLKPGCKFDTILVLDGDQGIGKSTVVQALCPDESWFSDSADLNYDPKETIEVTSGKLIVELGEIDGMTANQITRVKANTSRQVDIARMSYDRLVSETPRTFIYIGTANDPRFLRDQTGNRRFWPVKCDCTKANLKWLEEYRDQLWAEALQAVLQDEPLFLPESLWATAKEEQEARTLRTPQYEKLLEWLGDEQPGKIFTETIWQAFNVFQVGKRDARTNHVIQEAMSALGFEARPKGLRINGSMKPGYQRQLDRLNQADTYWELGGDMQSIVMKHIRKNKGGRPKKSQKVITMGAKKRTKKY